MMSKKIPAFFENLPMLFEFVRMLFSDYPEELYVSLFQIKSRGYKWALFPFFGARLRFKAGLEGKGNFVEEIVAGSLLYVVNGGGVMV